MHYVTYHHYVEDTLQRIGVMDTNLDFTNQLAFFKSRL